MTTLRFNTTSGPFSDSTYNYDVVVSGENTLRGLISGILSQGDWIFNHIHINGKDYRFDIRENTAEDIIQALPSDILDLKVATPIKANGGYGLISYNIQFEELSEAIEESSQWRIRKLTPREVFRLMDCSDDDIDKIMDYRWTETLKSGKVKECKIPKSALYKAAGNSICVGVLEAIFTKMFIAGPYPRATCEV